MYRIKCLDDEDNTCNVSSPIFRKLIPRSLNRMDKGHHFCTVGTWKIERSCDLGCREENSRNDYYDAALVYRKFESPPGLVLENLALIFAHLQCGTSEIKGRCDYILYPLRASMKLLIDYLVCVYTTAPSRDST